PSESEKSEDTVGKMSFSEECVLIDKEKSDRNPIEKRTASWMESCEKIKGRRNLFSPLATIVLSDGMISQMQRAGECRDKVTLVRSISVTCGTKDPFNSERVAKVCCRKSSSICSVSHVSAAAMRRSLGSGGGSRLDDIRHRRIVRYDGTIRSNECVEWLQRESVNLKASDGEVRWRGCGGGLFLKSEGPQSRKVEMRPMIRVNGSIVIVPKSRIGTQHHKKTFTKVYTFTQNHFPNKCLSMSEFSFRSSTNCQMLDVRCRFYSDVKITSNSGKYNNLRFDRLNIAIVNKHTKHQHKLVGLNRLFTILRVSCAPHRLFPARSTNQTNSSELT
ncbi:unnamed protein product, partial [Nesidiocoris tenuis]